MRQKSAMNLTHKKQKIIQRQNHVKPKANIMMSTQWWRNRKKGVIILRSRDNCWENVMNATRINQNQQRKSFWADEKHIFIFFDCCCCFSLIKRQIAQQKLLHTKMTKELDVRRWLNQSKHWTNGVCCANVSMNKLSIHLNKQTTKQFEWIAFHVRVESDREAEEDGKGARGTGGRYQQMKESWNLMRHMPYAFL